MPIFAAKKQSRRYGLHQGANGGWAMGETRQADGWASKSALILGADSANLSEMARLCRLAPISADADENWPLADIILADVRSAPDASFLTAISQYLHRRAVPVLAWTELSSLDTAYAAFVDADVHWLVGDNSHEGLAMLARLVHKPKPDAVLEGRDALDYMALHRISDELADFAHMLANIAGRGRSAAPSPPRTPVSFRKSEAGARALPLDPADIRELIRIRRLRDAYFEPGLFADPAWDVLLDLMAAKLERQNVSISSLCIAAAVPPTTALRCVTAMTENGLLERSPDPDDARRIFISLSPGAEAAMRRYLAETLG